MTPLGPVPGPLRRGSVLIVFVDFLEGALGAVGSIPRADLRQAARALAKAAALLDLPAIELRAPLRDAAPLPEIAEALPNRRVIAHAANDAWLAPEFVAAVRASGRRQLVFAGVATEVGVGLTALSAARAGYRVAVLADACGTVSARAEQAAFARLSQAGVILQSWSGFLGEIQESYLAPKGRELLAILAEGLSLNKGL